MAEHGYLKGNRFVENQPPSPNPKPDDGEGNEPKPPAKLVDVIVETVSKCSDEADDGVQLQVCLMGADRLLRNTLTGWLNL